MYKAEEAEAFNTLQAHEWKAKACCCSVKSDNKNNACICQGKANPQRNKHERNKPEIGERNWQE